MQVKFSWHCLAYMATMFQGRHTIQMEIQHHNWQTCIAHFCTWSHGALTCEVTTHFRDKQPPSLWKRMRYSSICTYQHKTKINDNLSCSPLVLKQAQRWIWMPWSIFHIYKEQEEQPDTSRSANYSGAGKCNIRSYNYQKSKRMWIKKVESVRW